MMKTSPEAASSTSRHGPGARGDLVAKQLRPDLEVRFGRICFGMFLDHGRIDGAQLGASLIEGDTGSETAEELSHAMDTAGDHGGGEMMRAGDDVGDDFGVLRDMGRRVRGRR